MMVLSLFRISGSFGLLGCEKAMLKIRYLKQIVHDLLFGPDGRMIIKSYDRFMPHDGNSAQ
jgi:hypothetical protein